MKPTAILLLTAVTVSLLVSCRAACQTQTAVNGDAGNYIEVIDNVAYAADCEAKCSATAGCNVFKYCNSVDNCKNYWSRGGPDDAYMSCTLATGPFDARPPNDETVAGFTIGQCSGSGTPDATAAPSGAALPADAKPQNLKGNVIQSSTTASAVDCAAQCEGNSRCNGWNWCTSTMCSMPGQCDLKQFDGEAEYWGDGSGGSWDGWVSGGIKPSTSSPAAHAAANFGGDVIVLDVNSMSYQGGPNHPGVGANTVEECAAACQKNDKCNTWVFCSGTDQYGCGEGCSRPAYEYNPQMPNDSTRFGMFGRCSCPGSNAPDRTDCYWPSRMCSLKYNAGQPPVYATGNGWVSGTVTR